MNSHGNRARLGGVLVAVAAVLALVALPGVASGHRNRDHAADAGTIQSFDPETGILTIDLTEGGSISGLVTPRTHIRCDNGRHRGRHGLRHHLRHRLRGATASHDRGGEGEESHRNGEGEPGDDHGEAGTEPGEDSHESGDDPPGHDGTAPGRSEGPGHGAEDSARCSTADLTAGETVKFAELVLVDGKAIYKVVALPKAEAEEGGESEAPPSE
jgi:hypothetical protein